MRGRCKAKLGHFFSYEFCDIVHLFVQEFGVRMVREFLSLQRGVVSHCDGLSFLRHTAAVYTRVVRPLGLVWSRYWLIRRA